MLPGVLVLNAVKGFVAHGLLTYLFHLPGFCSLQPFLGTPKAPKPKFILPWLLAEWKVLPVAGDQKAWQWPGSLLRGSVSPQLRHAIVSWAVGHYLGQQRPATVSLEVLLGEPAACGHSLPTHRPNNFRFSLHHTLPLPTGIF